MKRELKNCKRNGLKQFCLPAENNPPAAACAADHLNKHGLGDTMLRNQHQISIKCDSWSRQWRFYEDIPGHRLLLHVDIQWTMSVENNKTVLITYNNNNNSSHHVMLPNKSFCKIHFLVFATILECLKTPCKILQT